MKKTCLLAAAVAIALAPAPARAEFVPLYAEKPVEAEVGSQWLSEEWTAPDGTAYAVGGRMSKVALSSRFPFHGLIEARYDSSLTPLLRTETNETAQRFGNRLMLTWTQGRYRQLGTAAKNYWLSLGVGILAEHQWHLTSGMPLLHNRDYMDEQQLRLGPVGRMDILWLHPTDEAWRTGLQFLVMPRMLGFSSGGVSYPGSWLGLETSIGPSWHRGPIEVTAGGEAKLWVGEGMLQRAAGLYLRGTYKF
jgi:hypothetical protein